jgi:DNA-binding transcriptional LysR family regulator
MIEMSDLVAFVRVVEAESLTRAAKSLGATKSTVSRRITRLEKHLGSQLLHRHSHKVTPTDRGMVYFEFALRCIGLLRDGEFAVQIQQRQPQGVLRIAVPHELDRTLFGPLLTEYLDQYPDVRLVSILANEQVDLLRGDFDLAIVAGNLPTTGTSLIATKLGTSENGVYASPEYVERHGMPQSHLDLPRFDLLAWGINDARAQWRLSRADQEVKVEFQPRLICNDLTLLRHAVLSGLGISILPEFVCKHDLAAGRMVAVLPDWHAPDIPYYAIFPQHSAMPVRVRTFIDFLVDKLRPKLSWEFELPVER